MGNRVNRGPALAARRRYHDRSQNGSDNVPLHSLPFRTQLIMSLSGTDRIDRQTGPTGDVFMQSTHPRRPSQNPEAPFPPGMHKKNPARGRAGFLNA